MQQSGDAPEGLLDISELSLGDLDSLDASVLVVAVQELLDPDRRDGERIARFQSYTEPDS